MARNSKLKGETTMTKMEKLIGMTERSNAELTRMRGDNSELSNDQLESVAGGFFSFTPAVQTMISAMVAGGTPSQVGNYNAWAQYGVPPSEQPPKA